MFARRRLAVLGLLLCAAFAPMRATDEPHFEFGASHESRIAFGAVEDSRIELGAATFTRNGVASEDAARGAPGTPDAGSVRLPFTARGVRWATEFSTSEAFSARLALDWMPGPDGLLFEVVLDGQRLPPARDGWRPTPRALSSDLGPAWIGAGSHLLEFVAREQSPDAALHLRALVLQRL